MSKPNVAMPDPEDDWGPWVEWLRFNRNLWAHGKGGKAPDLRLVFEAWMRTRSGSGTRPELDWGDLASALATIGFEEAVRPAHIGTFAKLVVEAIEAKRALDPYAASVTFTRQIADASSLNEVLAVRHLQPEIAEASDGLDAASKITWIDGAPWEVLGQAAASLEPFDIVVSSPPLGMKLPPGTPDPQGQPLPRHSAENWVMAATAGLDTAAALFQVGDGIFFRQDGRRMLRRLADQGLHLSAAISLSQGMGSISNAATSFVFFTRQESEELFVGRVAPDQDPRPLIRNLLERREGKSPENGLLVDSAQFRGWEPLQAKLDLRRQLRVPLDQVRQIEDVAIEIHSLRLKENDKLEAADNSIYLYTRSNKVTLDPPEPKVKKGGTFTAYEVALDPEQIDAQFAVRWLNSGPGQLARSSLNTGSAVPNLAGKNVGAIPVVVPPLSAQRQAVELYDRLAALRAETEAIESDLALRPQEAERLDERLGSYFEDPVEAWTAQLPFPLASIFDRFVAEPTVEAKIDRLMHFFEAFAEFNVAVLLGAIRRDPVLWEQRREALAETGPDGLHALEKPTFGGWTHLGSLLSSSVRSALGTDNRPESRRRLLGVSDERFVRITSKDLVNALERARKLRNKRGHTQVLNTADKRELLIDLEGVLSQLREATENCFRRVLLVVPGPADYDGELYVHESCRQLRGVSANFRNRRLESLTQLKGRSMYFVDDADRVISALEVAPLLKLMDSPRGEENACFFVADRRDDGAYQFVSHHTAVNEPRYEVDTGLQQILDDLR